MGQNDFLHYCNVVKIEALLLYFIKLQVKSPPDSETIFKVAIVATKDDISTLLSFYAR